MNPIKKCYCRVYQTCFRLAMPFLPYREPKKLNDYSELCAAMKAERVTKLLLVTDPYLYGSGAVKSLEEALERASIGCAVYSKTQPNPTARNVEEAIALYRQEGCQALIGFGGGSSIDCAKAVGALAVYPKRTLDSLKGILCVWKKLPPLVAIPTTAGTGSEVTVTAVITDDVKKHKYTMNSFPLIPHYAVLDPRLTYTLPKHLTSTTGMDAMTHAVEAYIGRSTTKETRRLSLDAVKLVFENVKKAYDEPEDFEARRNMLSAAHMAGIAFSKSYVGYVHTVAHSLGGRYGTPHGLANAVLMPIVLEAYGAPAYKKLKEIAVYCGIAAESDSEEAAAKRLIAAIRALNKSMDIPEKIAAIREEDIPEMAAHADKEGNPLYPVPVEWDAKELEHLYRLAMAK